MPSNEARRGQMTRYPRAGRPPKRRSKSFGTWSCIQTACSSCPGLCSMQCNDDDGVGDKDFDDDNDDDGGLEKKKSIFFGV